MIKAGTIPKDKKMEDVSEDEQLFDLPENWIWTRMGELFQHNTGKALNGTNKDGEVLTYITTSNLYWNRFELDNLKSMPFTESEVDKCTVTKGDLLVCEGGDYGRAAIWNYDFDMRIQNHVHRLRAYLPLCTEYFYYVINFLKGTGLIKGKGIAIQGLSSGALHNLVVPLPPLEEQKRIVAKIEELMPFVEQYAKASTRLNTLNASFPDQMKKSILQQAVMGKLVPQDPNDEPASVLLKKIAEEKQKLIKEGKIKKQKALPAITEDEIPFDIPESWEFVRLGEVIELLSGIDFKPSEYSDISGKTVYITGASCLSDTGVIEQRWTDTPKNIAYRGDLLLVCKGSGYGKTVICDVDEAHIARQIMAIKKIGELNLSYIKYFLQSKISEIKRNGQGVIPGIDRGSVLNMILPLPSLEEQQRIVDQIDRLNDYVEGLRT